MKKQLLSGTARVVQSLDWVGEVALYETLNVCSDLLSHLKVRSRFNGLSKCCWNDLVTGCVCLQMGSVCIFTHRMDVHLVF